MSKLFLGVRIAPAATVSLALALGFSLSASTALGQERHSGENNVGTGVDATTSDQADPTGEEAESSDVAPAASPDATVPPEALTLFQQAAEHYRSGRFSIAVQLLEEAYEIHPNRDLLYNLARALEADGDLEGAIAAYTEYLGEDEANRDAPVAARLEALHEQVNYRRTLEEERQRALAQRDEARRSAEVEREARERELEENQRLRDESSAVNPIPWVVAGVGVAALAVGTGLGVVAQSRHDDAAADPVHSSAVETAAEADNLATASTIMLIAGGIVTVGGVTWGLIDLTTGDGEEESVALQLSPTGVSVRGRF